MRIEGDAKTISSAFVKARSKMNATVSEDGTGNFGKYATLAAIVKATTEHFASAGLAIVQEASIDELGLVIETWLVHESGATIQFTPLTLPLTDRRPQAVGSAITYGRRYALAAICGLAPEDDDAQAAQDAETVQNARKGTQQPRTLDAKGKAQQTPQRAPVSPDNDVEFGKAMQASYDAEVSTLPTDAELDVMGKWTTPTVAQEWAVDAGACANIHEAKRSFANVVNDHGGKLNTSNIAAVYLAWVRKCNAKLEQKQAA